MFGVTPLLHPPPSLPLHLPPLTLDNLGLMDAPALLSLPPLPLLNTKGRKDVSLPLPLPPPPPNTPLPQRENGYYLYSLVPSVLPSSSPHFFTNAKRSSEPPHPP